MKKFFIGFLFLFLFLSVHVIAQDYSPVDFPKYTMLDVKKRIFIKHNTDTVPLYRNDLYNMFLKLEKHDSPREITLGMKLTIYEVMAEDRGPGITYSEKQVRYKISEEAEDYIIIDMKSPPPAPIPKKVARMRIPVELTDKEKFLASFHDYFKVIPVPIKKYGEKDEDEDEKKTVEKVRNIGDDLSVSKANETPKKVEVFDMTELFQVEEGTRGIEVMRTDLDSTKGEKNMQKKTDLDASKTHANQSSIKNRPSDYK